MLDARESNRIGISATPATDRRNSTGSYAGNVASGLVWLFGYEEIGFLAPNLRTQNAKIRRFEELDEVEQYGTNWQ